MIKTTPSNLDGVGSDVAMQVSFCDSDVLSISVATAFWRDVESTIEDDEASKRLISSSSMSEVIQCRSGNPVFSPNCLLYAIKRGLDNCVKLEVHLLDLARIEPTVIIGLEA